MGIARARKYREPADNGPAAFRWLVIAAAVWASAIAGVAVYTLLHPENHTVFPIYATAARSWWAGRPLYFQTEPDEFLYSPLFAIFVSPLTFLGHGLGGMLWKLLNATAFVTALIAWLKWVRQSPLRPEETAMALLLALGEAMQSIYDGNANLMMLAAIMLGLTALTRNRTTRAAVWLSSATLVKAFPAALVGLLALTCGAAVVPPFAAALGAGLLIPIAIAPSNGLLQTRSWLQLLLARANEREIRYCSIDQLFRFFGHPLPVGWSNVLMVTGGILAAALCATYARRRDRREALAFAFAVFGAWVILFLPTMEPATVACIAPTIALSIVNAHDRKSYGWATTLLLAWWLVGPALTDIMGKSARIFAQSHAVLPMGGILFASYVGVRWWSVVRVAAPEPSTAIPQKSRIGIQPFSARWLLVTLLIIPAIAVTAHSLEMPKSAVTLLLLLPVLVVARLGGTWTGLIALGIAALLLTLMCLPPIGSLAVENPRDQILLGVFILSGIVGSRIMAPKTKRTDGFFQRTPQERS